jgi:predicted transcriptional regulator of viral defense system
MACSDIVDWFLQHRIAVIDLRSAVWHEARTRFLPAGYAPGMCMARLESTGRVRHLGRGLYQAVDAIRETPPIAVASGIFAATDHYLTTDAALTAEGLIDQPLLEITVVLPATRRARYEVGTAAVHPVRMAPETFARAEHVTTSLEGFPVRLATRSQAIVDALAEPRWIAAPTLLPEVLASLSESDLEATAAGAAQRTMAAAQRLGFLLDEARRTVPPPLDRLRPISTVELRPGVRTGSFSTRWRVYG